MRRFSGTRRECNSPLPWCWAFTSGRASFSLPMPATCPCCGITLRAESGTGLRNAPLTPRPSPICPWASLAAQLTPRPRLSSVEVTCSCCLRMESRNPATRAGGSWARKACWRWCAACRWILWRGPSHSATPWWGVSRGFAEAHASGTTKHSWYSSAAALEALQGLKRRGAPGGLLLADQRMPQMTGVEFLGQAMNLFPDAKRVLLTAYADTDAAIRAINDARIHHYLLKPWDPPEEHLYPVLDDLLEDWMASFRPPFEGVRVLGTRWSPHSYAIRDFLARNQAPYQWIDIETAQQIAEVRRLVKAVGAEEIGRAHV